MPKSSSAKKKRRKVSDDDTTTPSLLPSVALTASGGVGGGSATTAADASTYIEPNFDEIPKLVLVGLQKGDADEVMQALNKLHDLVDSGDEDADKKNCKIAQQAGAPAIVVLTMKKWLVDENIQLWGCACLLQFVHQCEGVVLLSVIQSGGLEAAVTALNNFPNSHSMNQFAWNFLRNISFYSRTETVAKASLRRFVEELDGWNLIKQSMRKFAEDLLLHQDCCAILSNMAYHKDFHAPLLRFGVTAVAIALENHPDDEEVKESAKRVMKKISVDGD